MTEKIELVLDAKAELGEGPCWDARTGILYWVDIEGEKVCAFNPTTGENKEIVLDQQVSAVVPTLNKDKLIVALEKGLFYLQEQTEELQLITEIERNLPDNRTNDGKCDAYGRFWIGTMNKKEEKEQGALYCLDTNGEFTKKLDNISTSNGLAWDKNNNYMYYIDTPTQKVLRYEFALDTAILGKAVEVVDFSDEEGFPDGMTIDQEGMLWIAHWGGSKVSRWNPNTNKKLEDIELPVLNVTSCTFGGGNLQELYITTARTGMSEEQLEKYPLSGGLFKATTKVAGMQSAFVADSI
ncbi:SMP-30/gluconolactonase/LRE family protein [Niallia nealsonii]|uniref:Regucalcin n=1 Tax=Niallia nealsonii TaxID=115979 RepID=A0A2N0YYF9_9BACI|nr:SMP-30/gluconolactonase/LRE family protein [Niallia nealsonii]PKG22296.1 SMP-30/gluconolaconase/LRE domain protein [Niallia nealsonii]